MMLQKQIDGIIKLLLELRTSLNTAKINIEIDTNLLGESDADFAGTVGAIEDISEEDTIQIQIGGEYYRLSKTEAHERGLV